MWYLWIETKIKCAELKELSVQKCRTVDLSGGKTDKKYILTGKTDWHLH